MVQSPVQNALGFLADRQLAPLSAVLLNCVVTVVKWEEWRRTRKGLRNLDDHMLDDIGVTRAQADHELTRSYFDTK